MPSTGVRPSFVLYATCQVENQRGYVTRVSECINGYLAAARSGLSFAVLGVVKDGNFVGQCVRSCQKGHKAPAFRSIYSKTLELFHRRSSIDAVKAIPVGSASMKT